MRLDIFSGLALLKMVKSALYSVPAKAYKHLRHVLFHIAQFSGVAAASVTWFRL
jgi:hypothetical protein